MILKFYNVLHRVSQNKKKFLIRKDKSLEHQERNGTIRLKNVKIPTRYLYYEIANQNAWMIRIFSYDTFYLAVKKKLQ